MKLFQRSADRYFDGYEAQPELTPSGKVRRKLVYVGDRYGLAVTGKERTKLKLLILLLTAVTTAFYLYGQLNPAEGGMASIVACPSLLVLFPLAFQWLGTIAFLVSREEWEKHSLDSGYGRMTRYAPFTVILLGLWIVLELVWIILNRPALLPELPYLASAVLAFVPALLLWRLLKRHPAIVVHEGKKPKKTEESPADDED